MKIGQVTLYNYNYGSALQCYATQKVLSNLGIDCVLIKRKEVTASQVVGKMQYLLEGACMCLRYPKYTPIFYRLWKSSRRTALKTLSEENLKAIEQFIDIEINSVEMSKCNMSIEAKKDKYTAFISGSDQIWNGDWFIINKMYFLRFAPKHKRIAWAPSFGTSSIAVYNRSKFKKYLQEYATLSVRESNGVEIIKELTGRDAEIVLDPVLLLTPSQWREEYSAKCIQVPDSSYMLLYFLDNPSDIAVDYIIKIHEETSLQILAFGHKHKAYAEMDYIQYVSGSPWNFVAMIDGANFVCTDSFHALAFSAMFHTQMFVFKRQYAHHSDQSSRILSFLSICNINDRFINNIGMPNLNKNTINFTYIDEVLDIEQEKSINYITNAIKLCARTK